MTIRPRRLLGGQISDQQRGRYRGRPRVPASRYPPLYAVFHPRLRDRNRSGRATATAPLTLSSTLRTCSGSRAIFLLLRRGLFVNSRSADYSGFRLATRLARACRRGRGQSRGSTWSASSNENDVVCRIHGQKKMFVHQTGQWNTGEAWVECLWYDERGEHQRNTRWMRSNFGTRRARPIDIMRAI